MTDLAVIMSVYQNDKLDFIKESVQSILSQTYTQFDFYIVFDGPVTAEVDNFISSLDDKRIKLHRLEKNTGLAGALNYLLEIVLKDPKYELIARMDADDISASTRLEIQHKFFQSNPDISCIGSWYQQIDEFGNVISYEKLPLEHTEIKLFFMKRSPLAHSSVMYRKGLIEKAGYYPTDTLRLEDNVLWGNAFLKGLKFSNVPEFLLKFRIDKDFYKKRSGVKYGTSFIITRFKILKALNAPIQAYLFSLMVGIVRMMPTFVIKSIYEGLRKKTDQQTDSPNSGL